MTRQRRGSRILEKAKKRLLGLKLISEKLQISKSLSVQVYLTRINALTAKLEEYNKRISDLDALQIEVEEMESELAEYSQKMLLGVAAEYGKDSPEYERAGGVRTSDRKRPRRKVAVAAG